MGISVGDLLSMDFFKDFHVIAGHKGLNREIQGVSFLEVPEGIAGVLEKSLFSRPVIFLLNLKATWINSVRILFPATQPW